MAASTMPPWAVRPLVPEEVYTDREEHLESLYTYALQTVTRRAMSTVLLGQRRMGKTEIFKRVVNRLFFEQEEHENLHGSVVPVMFTFPESIMDRWDFSARYVENFLRWYFAFRLRDPALVSPRAMKIEALIELVRNSPFLTDGLRGALNVWEEIRDQAIVLPEELALWLPRRVSDWDDSSIVMFLDEFQNTRLPQYGFDIVGFMQEAVESPTCPHFVTGSAMSILATEILGRGALFGRFESEPIGPMTEYWGAELALRCARYYRTRVTEDTAPVLASRCGGNPFYITAVIRRSAKQNKPLESEEQINEMLAVDLSSGFIWGELSEQVNRWIERINEHGITRWILYLSALEEGERIDLERIRRELWVKDRRKVSIENIRDVLIKLSRGDLVEFLDMGNWFRKIDDPILIEFLKVWGRITVEGQTRERVQKDFERQYQSLKRKIHNHLGYLGEVYMAQILWNGQHQDIPGRFFHHPSDVAIPWRFNYIWLRTSLGGAENLELDVEAAAGKEMWIGESKWWRSRKAGVEEVRSLMHKAVRLREREGPGLQILRLWLFCHGGFTREAQALMADEGILWSDRDDLNALLAHVGLKRLPEIDGEDAPQEAV